MQKKPAILFFLLLFALQQLPAQTSVVNLRCEMMNNPLGIDTRMPRFSWQIVSSKNSVEQIAYHILVASSKEKLDKNDGDIWDSKKINSSQSILVSYSGKVLASRIYCYWKVKSYTTKGETEWSNTAHWSMGLLNNSDWKGKWIGYDKASPWDSVTQWSRLSARYFRKQFDTKPAIKKATVYIVGLGLYELYINGRKIGDQVLAPSPTDYRKSVLYNTYDVTTFLSTGANTIATVLGNGRYFTMRQAYKPQKINTFGFPKMLLQLEIEYDNGTKQTIITDETWKLNADGPIRTNNEYDGEEYDARKELGAWSSNGYDDSKWLTPHLVKAPAGKIVSPMMTSMKVMQAIKPVSIKTAGNGKFIMDMGQNFSGWIKMNVQGKSGDQVQLRFAESLQPNGELYTANLRDAKVTDIYTLKGGGIETWQPSFVYHGFRYVEISGYPGTPSTNNFEGQFVYDELETTASFTSSNAVLNKIHNNAWWGIASNYKGMPVDCPQRNERQPWLGDRATGSGGEAFLFGNASLYAKWLDDIEQSQTTEGAIPDVAPAFWNYYSDNMTWPGTYMLVADMLYRQYGDKKPIIKHYASMKKWMEYMRNKYMKGYIVTKDKYGDWCVPPESLELIRSKDSLRTTRGELIATAYYYRLLQHLSQFAILAGKQADVKAYDELAVKISNAFQQKFFNKQQGSYDNNTITANILPLYFGITPANQRAAVYKNIYNRILSDQLHISTGVIGTQWLMRGLTANGDPGLAYVLASNNTYPSWGYMAEQGATTIWELWNGNTASPQMNSQNHVMLLGDLLIWMYENLAGIRSDDKAVGFNRIIMKPSFIDKLNHVTAAYRSVYGTIGSQWKKEAGKLNWSVQLPPNTKALIYIPATGIDEIREGGNAINSSDNIRLLRIENGNVVLEAGSGNYTFTVTSSSIK